MLISSRNYIKPDEKAKAITSISCHRTNYERNIRVKIMTSIVAIMLISCCRFLKVFLRKVEEVLDKNYIICYNTSEKTCLQEVLNAVFQQKRRIATAKRKAMTVATKFLILFRVKVTIIKQ